MLITADQIRAARALKSWSQTDLAERCNLAVPTIANIELGKQIPGKNTIQKIMDAFEANGIEFSENEGVSKKNQPILSFRGKEGIRKFMDLVYETTRAEGGSLCAINIDYKAFNDLFDDEFDEFHRQRMNDISDRFTFKALVASNKDKIPNSGYIEFRILENGDFAGIPFYVFADYLGIVFLNKDPSIVVIKNAEAASLYRSNFMQHWRQAKKLEKPTSKETKKGRK